MAICASVIPCSVLCKPGQQWCVYTWCCRRLGEIKSCMAHPGTALHSNPFSHFATGCRNTFICACVCVWGSREGNFHRANEPTAQPDPRPCRSWDSVSLLETSVPCSTLGSSQERNDRVDMYRESRSESKKGTEDWRADSNQLEKST